MKRTTLVLATFLSLAAMSYFAPAMQFAGDGINTDSSDSNAGNVVSAVYVPAPVTPSLFIPGSNIPSNYPDVVQVSMSFPIIERYEKARAAALKKGKTFPVYDRHGRKQETLKFYVYDLGNGYSRIEMETLAPDDSEIYDSDTVVMNKQVQGFINSTCITAQNSMASLGPASREGIYN